MDCDYEDMEFEYTNPQPFINTHYYDNNSRPIESFSLPPTGTFSIPSSFFEDTYKKSSIVTNTVCSLLDKFTLDENDSNKPLENNDIVKPVKDGSITPPHIEEEDNIKALVPINKVESPTKEEPIPYTPISSDDLLPFNKNTGDDLHLQQTDNPLEAQQQTNNQHYPSHTFIYHAAPNASTDHLGKSHGALYYISGIVKLICKTVLFVGFFYVLVHLALNFHHDMEGKIATYESDLLEDQLYCQQQYESNRCSPDTRLPAVKELCRNWERCMLRPISVSKTKVFGETFAELFNGFVNELSLRTMIYTVVVGLTLLWIENFLFRDRTGGSREKPKHTKDKIKQITSG